MNIGAESFVVKKKRKPDIVSQQEAAEVIADGIQHIAQLIKEANLIQMQLIEDMQLLSQGNVYSHRYMSHIRMQNDIMKQCLHDLAKPYIPVQSQEIKGS